jgi:transposase-like protein
MAEISYGRHRFPPVVIQHAVWLHLRFTLSYRDVEDLVAERGLDISCETDHEGEVLDMPVQRRRDGRAAVRLMRKLLKSAGLRCWSPTSCAPTALCGPSGRYQALK